MVDKKILPYLNEISDRLWSGHAALMVGAGFSKNAKMNPSAKRRFPNWNELGDIFYEKLNGLPPKQSEKAYLNVLKLAEEVEAAFGRNTLEKILKTEIPDKEFQPSALHKKTMILPWSDVFTTNYDTLLERTAETILEHRYETVVNKEDLVFSTKPRIIKLHGSFPSDRPFIITEEDYRKYPIEFAPFVNTVQQSLLENTLCLVGFSGNDPNFLKWIGWIHDNLGKNNSPKIFLIGIFSFTTGQKRLLEKRNIVPVDFSECESIGTNHEKAFNLFIDFLKDQGKHENNLDWPTNNKSFHYHYDDETKNDVSIVIENWKEQRQNYPNWLIVPQDRREVLFDHTNSNRFILGIEGFSPPEDIQFLFEYDWRLKKSLMPIDNTQIEYYEAVIEKYNPFPNTLDYINAITPENKREIDWKSITQHWLLLQLSMLRFYREEAFHSKWEKLADKIEVIIHYYSPEIIANYHYEKCLNKLFLLDIGGLRAEIANWETFNSTPYWEAKKAGLLAELGEISVAETILEESLKAIRDGLYLSPILNDYGLVSQEAYILQLLKYVKNSIAFSKRKWSMDDTHFKGYSERWNKLLQFKCDPWAELRYFTDYLKNRGKAFKRTERKYGFDIGSTFRTENFGIDMFAVKSYMFLRYMEETGIPFRIPNTTFGAKAAINAVSHISDYSPFWAFATYMRLGDTKGIDQIFGRKALAFMSNAELDELAINYLNVLEDSKQEIIQANEYNNRNFAISLATTIPEVLSRLSVKSSLDVKMKIFDFLESIINSQYISRYKGIKELAKRLIRSLPIKAQIEIIPRLLKLPLEPLGKGIQDYEYVDPLHFVSSESIKINYSIPLKIDNDIIYELLEYVKKENNQRKVAISRLVKLYELNALTKKQTDLFGQNLWSKVNDVSGFPSGTLFYNFAFLNFPHPKAINPTLLLKDYFKKEELPIQSISKKDGISMSKGNFPILHDIKGTSNENIDFIWEEEDLSNLMDKLISWWNLDKHYLKKKDSGGMFGSTRKEFKARFRHLNDILIEIIAPNLELLNKERKGSILTIIKELPEYGMPFLMVQVAFIEYLDKQEIQKSLLRQIYSLDRSKVVDALSGLLLYIRNGNSKPNELVSSVCENIKCLNNTDLEGHLTVFESIINKHEKIISSKHLEAVEIGLKNLLKKVTIKRNDDQKTVSRKIILKIHGAKLAVALKKYFQKNNLKEPEYINEWEESCMSMNEFSEVRKVWEDYRITNKESTS